MAPSDAMTWNATRLVWEAAGRPMNTTGTDKQPDATQAEGRCWWCAADLEGWARPRSVLPSTFPLPLQAAVPASEWLCMPCGWTLCDRIDLPRQMAEERIRMKARVGRRSQVSIDGREPERVITLELADCRVGLWTYGPNAAAEKPWQEARDELREDPRDVGPCKLIDIVTYDRLDAGPVEKFRSFHHAATPDRWWPCTDTDRMEIRAWLFNPPPPPWVMILGDGKKHHAISAALLDAVTRQASPCVVYWQGQAVTYEPQELQQVVAAIEALAIAGARDEEVSSGEYMPRGVALALALRTAEPVVAPVRGSPLLDLALYLRRNRKELEADAG